MKVATTPARSPHFGNTRRSSRSQQYAKAVVPDIIDDDIETTHTYPETTVDRASFVSPKSKRRVTEFQYRV
ncbi:hypothetical protein GGF47_003379, partial [Coemansia sp. RSA 2524]